MVCASVGPYALSCAGGVLYADRLLASLALGDAAQHVLVVRPWRDGAALACLVSLHCDQLLHCLPDRLIDDAPLRDLSTDDLGRIRENGLAPWNIPVEVKVLLDELIEPLDIPVKAWVSLSTFEWLGLATVPDARQKRP